MLGEFDGSFPFGVALPDSEIATQCGCPQSYPSILLTTFRVPPDREAVTSVIASHCSSPLSIASRFPALSLNLLRTLPTALRQKLAPL